MRIADLENRKFVLEPLGEIAPDLQHPVLKQTILEILKTLSDSLSVAKR